MADNITGTSHADTIFAGGNDTINPGNGADEIYLAEADSEEAGAVIVMSSSNSGRKEVHGFSFGFDNENAGNTVLDTNMDSISFGIMIDTLVATIASSRSNNHLLFFADTADMTSDKTVDLLIGDADDSTKLTIIKGDSSGNREVTVSSNDEVADRYYGLGRSTLTFSANITDSLGINLGNGSYTSISALAVYNENEAIILGSTSKDIVSLGGSADADARKSVSLGAGDDVIYSGGSSTSTAGNTIFFGSTSGDGDDTINNFGFYQGKEDDPERESADVLILNGWNDSVSRVTANTNDVAVALSTNNTVHIAGTVDPNNIQMIRYSVDDGANVLVAKIGVTSGQTNNFTYDKEVDYYQGNTGNNQDTLTVENLQSNANVEIWLDGSQGISYNGIGVIDASQAEDTQLTLVGNAANNTIKSGGEGTTVSLWGGGYGNNELIGGDGNDIFFFLQSESNDTISGFDSANDRIRLYDITLDDIMEDNNYGLSNIVTESDGTKTLTITTKGVGTLKLNGNESDINGAKFDVSNGDGSYTAYTATKNSDGSWGWENR